MWVVATHSQLAFLRMGLHSSKKKNRTGLGTNFPSKSGIKVLAETPSNVGILMTSISHERVKSVTRHTTCIDNRYLKIAASKYLSQLILMTNYLMITKTQTHSFHVDFEQFTLTISFL